MSASAEELANARARALQLATETHESALRILFKAAADVLEDAIERLNEEQAHA